MSAILTSPRPMPAGDTTQARPRKNPTPAKGITVSIRRPIGRRAPILKPYPGAVSAGDLRHDLMARIPWVDGHADVWPAFADPGLLPRIVDALAAPYRGLGVTK